MTSQIKKAASELLTEFFLANERAAKAGGDNYLHDDDWSYLGGGIYGSTYYNVKKLSTDVVFKKSVKTHGKEIDGWPQYIKWAMKSKSIHVPVVYKQLDDGDNMLYTAMERLYDLRSVIYGFVGNHVMITSEMREMAKQWEENCYAMRDDLRSFKLHGNSSGSVSKFCSRTADATDGYRHDLHSGNLMVRIKDGVMTPVVTDPVSWKLF